MTEFAYRCPACHGTLTGAIASLSCAGCGLSYGALDGVPVLLPHVDPASVDRRGEAEGLPTHNATQLGLPAVDAALGRGDQVLELGAGVDVSRSPLILKTDAFVYAADSLDVVADAHALPFEDGSFDFVFSLAVFEHLARPWVAAREIARVLRPGGRVFTLCAFMQPLHGWPDHYFNMTASGLREIFGDGFEIESAGPSRHCPDAQAVVPLHVMRQMARDYDKHTPSLAVRFRVRQLNWAATVVARRYAQLGAAMIARPEGYAEWTKIAPAVEITARRSTSGLSP